MKRLLLGIWEILEIVVVAVVTVFLIRTFLVQPFLVSGASMEPNFYDGNYLLIDEITYRFREPQRGEVIVFHYPRDKSLFFIKRIIGMPGERIISMNGKIKIINGESELVINENYLDDKNILSDNFDIKLEAGEYFVLGDNRSHSFDSRSWGAVSIDEIVGIARLRIFPINEFTVFKTPELQP